jgi:hypothetical protein
MVRVTDMRSDMTIQMLVAQIATTGQLSRREHVQLTSTILADHQLSDEDRRHISRLLDYVQIGRLRLID